MFYAFCFQTAGKGDYTTSEPFDWDADQNFPEPVKILIFK